MKAVTILTTAAQIVEGNRQQAHGRKERSFQTIAAFWSAYLERRGELTALEPQDVAHMMVLLKLARAIEGDSSHEDHYIDGAGYFSLAGELATGVE